MAGFQEFLENEGYEQFKKALYLTREASKNDPENEPYRSLYEARTILSDLKARVKEFQSEDGESKTFTFAIAALDVQLGANYCETDETSTGEEHLTRALKSLEEAQMEDEAISVHIQALNQLGILWSARGQHDKAKSYLDKAESLFLAYKENIGSAPKSADEFFSKLENDENEMVSRRARKFESTHTYTLYYKAQVLAKLGDSDGSAKYCHITLRRQLDSHEYDATDWALNAATLSQVYLTQGNFTLARHCLASASVIFQETQSMREESDEARENWEYKDADIRRCWVKYGLQLLEASRDEMLKQVDTFDKDHNMEEEQEEKSTKDDHNADLKSKDSSSGNQSVSESSKNLEEPFEPFNLEVTHYEEKVTDKLVKTFEEARNIFLFIQDGINYAKKVYNLDGNCTDYIELIQDHSRAYKLLAFFELDMERQCRMHKRRIDMLLATVNELNPQFYLLVCRQLIFEIAETYSSMLDLKLSMIELQGNQPTPHAVKKINQLAQQSIKQYEAYLDTLKGGKPDFPDTFPDGNTRPALVAMFSIGRLWGKILTPEVGERLACIKHSLDHYKFVVDYCRRHPEAKAEMQTELSLCEELTALLPVKMEKIRAEAAS